jgi:hypothetical protein
VLADADLSKCRVLNNAEMLAQVYLAITANVGALPQIAGPTQPRRGAAIRLFAADVTAQLLLSNTRLVQGPSSSPTPTNLYPR